MIRSGRSAAIFSNGNPSAALRTVGFASPSSSRAHGQTACGCSPYHSVVAIGLNPSARIVSCSVSPTLTMRRGASGTVVEPNLWSTVTAVGGRPAGRIRLVGAAAGHEQCEGESESEERAHVR